MAGANQEKSSPRAKSRAGVPDERIVEVSLCARPAVATIRRHLPARRFQQRAGTLSNGIDLASWERRSE